jgi:hypothetical protein
MRSGTSSSSARRRAGESELVASWDQSTLSSSSSEVFPRTAEATTSERSFASKTGAPRSGRCFASSSRRTERPRARSWRRRRGHAPAPRERARPQLSRVARCGARFVEHERAITEDSARFDAPASRCNGERLLFDDALEEELEQPIGFDRAREPHDRARAAFVEAIFGVDRDDQIAGAHPARLGEDRAAAVREDHLDARARGRALGPAQPADTVGVAGEDRDAERGVAFVVGARRLAPVAHDAPELVAHARGALRALGVVASVARLLGRELRGAVELGGERGEVARFGVAVPDVVAIDEAALAGDGGDRAGLASDASTFGLDEQPREARVRGEGQHASPGRAQEERVARALDGAELREQVE